LYPLGVRDSTLPSLEFHKKEQKARLFQQGKCKSKMKTLLSSGSIVPLETIERRIFLIRGQKVMLDRDLAVKRNT
jgi:hypothetical protein